MTIKIQDVKIDTHRRAVDEKKVKELAESISKIGMLKSKRNNFVSMRCNMRLS
jgi:ParB-like chromosome segregation protein Spo0J